jgi:hypothetical protein
VSRVLMSELNPWHTSQVVSILFHLEPMSI